MEMIVKKLQQWALVLLMVMLGVFMNQGQAKAAVADSVVVDGVVLSRCGTQGIPFSGSATYSGNSPHLVVQLDGSEILHSHTNSVNWITPFITTGVGQHTVTATIYNDNEGSHGNMLATNSMTFTVVACEQPSVGGGDEKDCCPGKDVDVPKVPKVLGITTKPKTHKVKPQLLKSLNGEVVNLSEDRIEVKYVKADGTVVYRKFHLTEKTQMRKHITIGSQVKIVFSPGSNVALKVLDRSPDSTEQLWGANNSNPWPT